MNTYHRYNLGGTEIYEPLEHIFKQPFDESLTRHIFLLTDGSVDNTQSVIDLIEAKVKSSNQRVHTVGMGSGASKKLVKGAAKAGNGTSALIADTTLVEEKVMASLQKLYMPMRRVSKI